MGLFGKWKERGKASQSSVEEVCKHAELAPMWDSVADIGLRDRITRYKCPHCQRIFGVEEGRTMLETGGVAVATHP